MNCNAARNLVHGYVDGQLEPGRVIGVEQHLGTCAACRQIYNEQSAVRSAVKQKADYFPASKALRARIRAALPADETEIKPAMRLRRPLRAPSWLTLGASLAFAVMVTWGLAVHLAVPPESDRLVGEIVSGHVRSLMADHLADVASSDQHTVKPWFSGKVDFSPPVVDLAASGFPLVGGRLDYLDGRPVAALVYRRREHVINLFVWPVPDGKERSPQTWSKQGFHLVGWARSGMSFWAVSDLNSQELGEFARALAAPTVPPGTAP